MNPEPANCPVCANAAERVRQRGAKTFIYRCPVCGTFELSTAAIGHTAELPARQAELRCLRAYGYRPRIDFHAKEGLRIRPAN